MLKVIRYVFYRINKYAKEIGTAGTAGAEGGTFGFTTLPILFYLFSLSNVVCIIIKTELGDIDFLFVAVLMIAAYVYIYIKDAKK
jgi:hypothetical protein